MRRENEWYVWVDGTKVALDPEPRNGWESMERMDEGLLEACLVVRNAPKMVALLKKIEERFAGGDLRDEAVAILNAIKGA